MEDGTEGEVTVGDGGTVGKVVEPSRVVAEGDRIRADGGRGRDPRRDLDDLAGDSLGGPHLEALHGLLLRGGWPPCKEKDEDDREARSPLAAEKTALAEGALRLETRQCCQPFFTSAKSDNSMAPL